MKSRLDLRRILVAVLAGVLIGGGLMAVTPAGAEVAQVAATNWKKIWKKKLQPLADKRYYTKQQSDSTFLKKSDAAATYQPKGNYALAGSSYTKAEVDAKLAPLVNSVAATAGGDQTLALSATDQVARSVSLMPPANGTVIVSSSAYVWATANGDAGARCSITPTAQVDFDFLQYANLPGATVPESEVVSGTRGFAVTKGNLFTVNLVCDSFSGSVAVSDSSLTAIFAPS